MPIRLENRHRYPKDWKQIRQRIMQRAQDRCECTGECGDEHQKKRYIYIGPNGGDVPRCAAKHGTVIARLRSYPAHYIEPDDAEEDVDYYLDPVRVVLTIAHRDHTPENNDDSNLAALCQRCHLRLDRDHHAATARATRRSRKAAGDLFGARPEVE